VLYRTLSPLRARAAAAAAAAATAAAVAVAAAFRGFETVIGRDFVAE